MSTRIFLPFGFGLLAALAITCPAAARQAAAPAQNPGAPADSAGKPQDTSNPPAKKVYTNDDLNGHGKGEISVVGSSKQAVRPGDTATNGPKNEQYWRSRAQKLRNQMADVDRQIAQVEAANQKERAAATNPSGTSPQTAPVGAYYGGSRASNQYENQMKRLKVRKAQIQEQIDQMEEEARRANVPPGWLR